MRRRRLVACLRLCRLVQAEQQAVARVVAPVARDTAYRLALQAVIAAGTPSAAEASASLARKLRRPQRTLWV